MNTTNALNTRRGMNSSRGLLNMLMTPGSRAGEAYCGAIAARGYSDVSISVAIPQEAKKAKADLKIGVEATLSNGRPSKNLRYGISVKKSSTSKGTSVQVGRGWCSEKIKDAKAAALAVDFLGLGSKIERLGQGGKDAAIRDEAKSDAAMALINADAAILASLVETALAEFGAGSSGVQGLFGANILHLHFGWGDSNGMRGRHQFCLVRDLKAMSSKCSAKAVKDGKGASIRISYHGADGQTISVMSLKRKGGSVGEPYPDHLQITGHMRGLSAMAKDLGTAAGSFSLR